METRWHAGAALVIGTLVILALHYWHGITVYPYDARDYWNMAVAPHTIRPEQVSRGYLFPAMLRVLVAAGAAVGLGAVDAFRILSSLVYSAALTLLVPATMARMSGAKLNLPRRLGPLLLVAAVFPGLLLYPLSDLPALAFMWLCVHLLLICRDDGQDNSHGPGRAVAMAVLAGLAAGAAYNTRTIYLFPVALAALAVLLQFGKRWHCLIYGAIGFAIASAPQVLINQQSHGVASPNPTVAYGDTSLFALQLALGVSVQKAETSIAGDAATAAISYVDPAGRLLLAEICKDGPITNVAGYLATVLRHPVEFAGLYTRHFINGLDVRDGMVYVTQPGLARPLLSFACITLVLVMLLAIKAGAGSSPRTPGGGSRAAAGNTLYAVLLVLPALLTLAGAVETRFMLPLMLYLAARASATGSLTRVLAELRGNLPAWLALALAVYAVFFAVTQSTLANVRGAPSMKEYGTCPAAPLTINKP